MTEDSKREHKTWWDYEPEIMRKAIITRLEIIRETLNHLEGITEDEYELALFIDRFLKRR